VRYLPATTPRHIIFATADTRARQSRPPHQVKAVDVLVTLLLGHHSHPCFLPERRPSSMLPGERIFTFPCPTSMPPAPRPRRSLSSTPPAAPPASRPFPRVWDVSFRAWRAHGCGRAHVAPPLLQNGLLEDGLALAGLDHAVDLGLAGALARDRVHPPLHHLPAARSGLSQGGPELCIQLSPPALRRAVPRRLPRHMQPQAVAASTCAAQHWSRQQREVMPLAV